MSWKGLDRRWLAVGAAAAVIVVAVVVALVVRGTSSSKPSAVKPVSTIPVATPGGRSQTVTTAGISGKRSSIRWSTFGATLSGGQLLRLRTRVSDNDRPHEVLHTLKVSSTTVPGFAALTKAAFSTAPSPNLRTARDQLVADPTNADSVSAKEPSVAADGNTIITAGNWYADRSTDGGRTWQQIDPYAQFGQDFCCDQVVIYDPRHNVFFWLLQMAPDKGGMYLKLAVSTPSDAFSTPCVFTFHASGFGMPSTGSIDYNDLALSNSYLYVNSNVYASDTDAGRAGMMRLPIAQLVACGHVSWLDFSDPKVMNLRPVQGATDTMYFGTDTVRTHALGSWFRIYAWPESATSLTWYERKIAQFNYETPDVGGPGDGRCGSADGKVRNWCQRTQGKTQGGAVTGRSLIFAFNASELGAARPFPYIRLVYFDRSTLSYQTSKDIWSSTVAILYPSMAVNARGDLGGVFAWGGGTGSQHFYPGSGVFIFGPGGARSEVSFYLYGHGNACIYKSDNTYRWGDYLTVRLHYPDGVLWEGTGFTFQGGDCGAGGHAEDHVFLFGRPEDVARYAR